MKMNSYNTNAHDFRSSKRKCFSLVACLIFVLLMSEASCRPSETNGDISTYNDKDYVDADDIDWQNFAAVETSTKEHPIIFYKEDIVSEDYDPSKEKNKMTSSEKYHTEEIKPHHRRKYKEISRHHRRHNQTKSFRYIKPEKVYFDIYPIGQDDVEEDINEDNSKFNEDDIDVEVISLLDDDNNKNKEAPEDDSKRLLGKTPKKYNHRHRRDVKVSSEEATKVSLRHKRNPFYHRNSHYANELPQYHGVFFHPQLVIYPAKGSAGAKIPIKSPYYYNAYSPSNVFVKRPTSPTTKPDGVPDTISQRFDEDRPVWPIEGDSSRPATTRAPMRTLPPRRTSPPLVHVGDEDYISIPSNSPAENRSSGTSASAAAGAGQWSLPVPQTTSRPATRPPTTTPAPSRGISACIWAISSCCTRSANIRYQCFERLGCSGAFWDLNPCADDIFRLAVKAADQYLE